MEKSIKQMSKKELLDYKKQLEQLLILDEAWHGPWYVYHSSELSKVEAELKCRGI